MLLNADLETSSPPKAIGFFDSAHFAVPVEVGRMPGDLEDATGIGPPPPSALTFSVGGAWSTETAVRIAPASLVASTLLVRDGSGNFLSSSSGSDSEALKPLWTGFAPQQVEQVASTGPQIEAGPPAPDELAAFPRMPWSPSYSYSGSMDGRNETAVRIPVGPSTRTLTLGLKPGDRGDPYTPRIEGVFLLGRGGEVLTRISGVSILGDETGQTLFITIQGAPMGGEVLVRLVPMPAAATSSPPDTAPQVPDGEDGGGDGEGPSAPGEGMYFELSIRRNDANSPGGGAPATTAGPVGISYSVIPGRFDVSTSIGPLTSTNDATTSAPESGPGPRVAAATTTVRTDLDVDLADEGPVEVFLGPLVSRTAAALGPALATSSEEPTPSTDRGSRSQPEGLAAFGADMDLDMILAIRASGDHGSPADPAEAELAMTTLRGPGGVPIVVAGLRAGDRDRDEAELASSALGSVQDGPLLAGGRSTGAAEVEAEVAHAGLATRALGFLIGMGLASGPLYPDLVALARRRFRRKPRRVGKRRPQAR